MGKPLVGLTAVVVAAIVAAAALPTFAGGVVRSGDNRHGIVHSFGMTHSCFGNFYVELGKWLSGR